MGKDALCTGNSQRMCCFCTRWVRSIWGLEGQNNGLEKLDRVKDYERMVRSRFRPSFDEQKRIDLDIKEMPGSSSHSEISQRLSLKKC